MQMNHDVKYCSLCSAIEKEKKKISITVAYALTVRMYCSKACIIYIYNRTHRIANVK